MDWISFSKTSVILDWHVDTKSDDEESVLLLLHKISVLFYPWLQGCRDEVYVWVGDGGERGLNKWNQGKIIEPS